MNGPGSSSAQACCRSAGCRPNPRWAGRTLLTLGFAQDADLQVVQRLSAPQVVSVRAEAGLDLRSPAALDDEVARVVTARPRVFGSYMSPGCLGRTQNGVQDRIPAPRPGCVLTSKLAFCIASAFGACSANTSARCRAGHSRACPGSKDRLQRIVLCHPVALPDFLKLWPVVRLPASGRQEPEDGFRVER